MNENATSGTRGIVVVGVDGSAGARAAMRWAIAESRLRQARLRAVHAWVPECLAGGYASMGGVTASWPPARATMHAPPHRRRVRRARRCLSVREAGG